MPSSLKHDTKADFEWSKDENGKNIGHCTVDGCHTTVQFPYQAKVHRERHREARCGNGGNECLFTRNHKNCHYGSVLGAIKRDADGIPRCQLFAKDTETGDIVKCEHPIYTIGSWNMHLLQCHNISGTQEQKKRKIKAALKGDKKYIAKRRSKKAKTRRQTTTKCESNDTNTSGSDESDDEYQVDDDETNGYNLGYSTDGSTSSSTCTSNSNSGTGSSIRNSSSSDVDRSKRNERKSKSARKNTNTVSNKKSSKNKQKKRNKNGNKRENKSKKANPSSPPNNDKQMVCYLVFDICVI